MVEKTSTKDADTERDLFNLLVLTGVVILLFLYTKIVQNRQYWIQLECVLGVVYAVMFMFAGVLVSYIVKTPDGTITYLTRLVLVAMMSQTATVFFSKDSFDRTVPIAVSIANLLSRGPILLMEASMAYFGKRIGMDKTVLYWDVAFLFLLVAGDLYHIANSKTRNYSHRTVGDPVSLHLSIDAIVNFCLGAFILGFPDMFFSMTTPALSVKPMHLYCAKAFGILLLGGSILSFASLCYRDDDDAVGTLKAKLVIYLAAELLALTSIIIDSQFRTFGHTAIMLGVMGGLAFNAGSMVYQHEKWD